MVQDISTLLPESAQAVVASAWGAAVAERESEIVQGDEGPDNRLQSYEGDILRAAAMQPVLCCEDMIGINLMARDGTVYAHAHFDFATAEEFLAEFIAMLREGMGASVQ